MQVQACSLYIHFTTLGPSSYNLKTLTGPITFFSGYGSWGHKKNCSTSIKGLKCGIVLAARAVRLQIWENCSCKQTSGLTHYILLWPGWSSHGQCGSAWRSTLSQSSLRSYNEYSCITTISLVPSPPLPLIKWPRKGFQSPATSGRWFSTLFKESMFFIPSNRSREISVLCSASLPVLLPPVLLLTAPETLLQVEQVAKEAP